ncbi:MAG TPA: hypothetical protein VGA37_02410 [Gemmatimonadales bacterium]
MAWTWDSDENSMAHESLEDLGEEGGRYGLGRSDAGQRDGLAERMRGQHR